MYSPNETIKRLGIRYGRSVKVTKRITKSFDFDTGSVANAVETFFANNTIILDNSTQRLFNLLLKFNQYSNVKIPKSSKTYIFQPNVEIKIDYIIQDRYKVISIEELDNKAGSLVVATDVE